MEELIPCNHCGASISDTAMLCPMCLNTQDIQDAKTGLSSITKKTIIYGAYTLIFSPFVVGAVLADEINNSKIIKEAMALGKSSCAIDAFYLADMLVMVTNIDFIFILGGTTLGLGGPTTLMDMHIPRETIQEVYIDENGSRAGNLFQSSKTFLCVRTSDVLNECASYEFKGKHSRELAEFARFKLMEYCKEDT